MDIVSIGEPMMEFRSANDGMYQEGVGGDTSNFLVAAARQGAKTAYITQVGQDAFGDAFMELWRREGVDTSYVKRVPDAHTGLYFITYAGREHKFSYFRKGSAASRMTPSDIPKEAIAGAKLLHVSGISQAISNSACDAVFAACQLAKKNRVAITYDPNIRLSLWPRERAAAMINGTVPYCDIFLPSLEDAQSLTGIEAPDRLADYYHSIGVKVLVLKLGSKGVLVSYGGKREVIPGFSVETVDQTGAGDTFDGAFCSQYIKGKDPLECARYANGAAALSTRGYGAVKAIPKAAEVEEFLHSR